MVASPQSHKTRTHNITEWNYSNGHLVKSRNTDSQHHTRERNYYDWRVIRRDEVQQKSSVAPIDFYGTYDPRKFCEWIAHLNYYFDLYELSEMRKVWFATCKLRCATLDYWIIV